MSVSENGIQSAMQRLTAAQAEIARLTAERDAAMAGRARAIDEAILVVREECWKDREMKLFDKIHQRLAALAAMQKGG